MTSNGLEIVTCIFSNAWKLFNSWHIPGTNVSPAMWFVFLLVIPMGIKMVLGILGMTGVFSAYNIEDGIKGYRVSHNPLNKLMQNPDYRQAYESLSAHEKKMGV